jgi:AcrR family transcriptional regulator
MVENQRSPVAPKVSLDDQEVRERVLAAAAALFYAHGITAVGIDDIRAASGIPLKRLYQCFRSKEQLVEAYLTRRDQQWLADLERCVDRYADPGQRVLAVFTFLAEWFTAPGFRGCAFINAFGELADGSGPATQLTRLHKRRLRRYLAQLTEQAGAAHPARLAAQLLILMDGAIVSAATGANARAAADARAAAAVLLDAGQRARPSPV